MAAYNMQFVPAGQFYQTQYGEGYDMTGFSFNQVYCMDVGSPTGAAGYQPAQMQGQQAWQSNWQTGQYEAQAPWTAKSGTSTAINLDDFSDYSDSESEVDMGEKVVKSVEDNNCLERTTSELTEPAVEPSPKDDVEEQLEETSSQRSTEPASEPAVLEANAGFSDQSDCSASETEETKTTAQVPIVYSPQPPAVFFYPQQVMVWGCASPWNQGSSYQSRDNWSSLRQSKTSVPTYSAPSPVKLESSENSWAARQKALRASLSSDEDAKVARTIKSILNKLTLEKFSQLRNQLLDCGISKSSHVELLIQEVFDKATSQHHFIDMYADLCVFLHEHLSTTTLSDDAKFSFRRLLLNECQTSFDRFFTPPVGLEELDPEERQSTLLKYKTQMIGNIRFVGSLMARQMLSSKVMMVIIEELLEGPTPEALECLAAFLTVVGGTFDNPKLSHFVALDAVFKRIETLIQTKACQSRERYLLQDVLDLRTAGWKCTRPQKLDKPMTLEEVAKKKMRDEMSLLLTSTR